MMMIDENEEPYKYHQPTLFDQWKTYPFGNGGTIRNDIIGSYIRDENGKLKLVGWRYETRR